MAELALAIVPLGITVTSGLVKYLKAFNDHDDDRTRVVRQAERLSSTFQSLEAALNRSQLDPELSASASQASGCLKYCQKALEELDILQQKTFATTTSIVAATSPARTKDKIKDGYRKLIYPLRKSDIESLGGALDRLSTTLSLALEMLHIDEESLTRKLLNDQIAEIQKNTIVNSNTATAIRELHQPIKKIDLAVPALQTSVDSIAPHLDQSLALIEFVNGNFVPASIYGPLIAGNDVEDISPFRPPFSSFNLELFKYHEHNPKVAEQRLQHVPVQYGPLSLAVIRNNLPEVERLISLHPQMLEELSSYWETPLHVAIYRPKILKALTKKVNPEVWIRLNSQDATVLNLTIRATFAALDFRHTCLDRPGYSRFPGHPGWKHLLDPVTELEPDEMEFETLNVNGEAWNQLEEVVAMFQDFVLTGCQTTISNKSDTLDIDYAAFNDPAALGIDDLYYQRILEFWHHIWVRRIQVALDTVAESWEDKLNGLHDPVQLSTCEEAGDVTKGSEEIDDDAKFNRLIQQIQDI
nr:hypothetical protein FVER53263_13665 [Fusarium verticillioides]